MNAPADATEFALFRRYETAASAMEQTRALVALSEYRTSYGDVLLAEQALAQANGITPQHCDLILRRARLLNQLGRWRDSLNELNKVQQQDRGRAAFWLCVADTYRHGQLWPLVKRATRAGLVINGTSQGLLLLDACADAHEQNWPAAQATFTGLPPNAEAFEMFAAAQAHHKKSDEAQATLEKGLELFPSNSRLIYAICMLRWMLGDSDTFADPALAALETFSSDLSLWMTTADLLRRAGHLDRALALLKKAKRKFVAPQLNSALALLMSVAGDVDGAQLLLTQSTQGQPRLDWIARNSAVIHLTSGNPTAAQNFTRWGLERDRLDQEWIALDAIANRLNGDPNYENVYNYGKFVGRAKVDLSDENGSHAANFAALNAAIREFHIYTNHPLDQSLRRGSQLPLEPQTRMSGPFATFFSAIEAPITDYLAKLGRCADHPFLSRNQGNFDISGAWSVQLKKGGQHVNHIHPEGWLSAVYYLSLPNDSPDFLQGEGDLCFGQPNFKVPDLPPDHKMTPTEGELIVFPSYFWHGTIPLSQSHDRLTLAFDLVPKVALPNLLEDVLHT